MGDQLIYTDRLTGYIAIQNAYNIFVSFVLLLLPVFSPIPHSMLINRDCSRARARDVRVGCNVLSNESDNPVPVVSVVSTLNCGSQVIKTTEHYMSLQTSKLVHAVFSQSVCPQS